MIPILENHDHNKVIGFVKSENGYEFSFLKETKITKSMMFDIFGNAGIRVTEMEEENGEVYIKAGEIFEFSLSA